MKTLHTITYYDLDSDSSLYSSRMFYCFNAFIILLPLFCVWFAVYCLLIDPHIIQHRKPSKPFGTQIDWSRLSICVSINSIFVRFALLFTWFQRKRKMPNAKSTTFDNNCLNEWWFSILPFFPSLENFVCVIIVVIGGHLIDRWTNCY